MGLRYEKIIKLNPQYFIAIGLISMSIGGIWEIKSEENNFIQLGLFVLGSTSVISGAIIGLIQKREIIKKNKDNN